MADPIRVVSAVIIKAGRVLLTQRGPTQDYAFRWESPGGKVEPGESDRQALAREVREELGVTGALICPEPLASFAFEAGGDIIRDAHVTLYSVYFDSQQPRPLQSIGLGWFTATDVHHLDLLPANYAYRGELAARLARSAHHG